MRSSKLLLFLFVAFFSCALSRSLVAADKVSPEEVIAKSIQSFGPADVRTPATGRELDVHASWRNIVGGAGALEGDGALQTRGGKFHLNMGFNNTTYPGEDIVYSGEGQPVVKQVVPGQRSTLGEFIFRNPAIVRSGLLGGVLNSAWPLFRFEESGAKLVARGSKKVDGFRLNEFEYEGKNQGEIKIYLYFDAETNQHVMTQYVKTVPGAVNTGGIGGRERGQGGRDITITMEERFSQFRQAFGMNIPLLWTIRFVQEQGMMQQWQFTLVKQKLDVPDEVFAVK